MKEKFLAKAWYEYVSNGVSSIFVIPDDATNRCWLDHIYGKATKITLINCRIKFIDPVTAKESRAGLGAAIIEFQAGEQPADKIWFIERDKIKPIAVDNACSKCNTNCVN